VIDGQQRRVGKKVGGTLVQGLLYRNGLVPVAEFDGAGGLVARFVYGTRAYVPDYLVKDGSTLRLVTDQLGSIRLVIDATSGAIMQRMEYDAFGRVLTDTNPGFQPFGFAGGLYDAATGLVRFGARDYEPTIGRWTAQDPLRFASGDTNLYGYVMNDPVNAVDPTGHGPPAGVMVGFQIGGALKWFGGEAGFGLFVDVNGQASFFGTYGHGPALGLGIGASGVLGWVDNPDAFWGPAFEYGVNIPGVAFPWPSGLSFSSAPDPDDPQCSSGLERAYGESVSAGVSIGVDVHFFKTNTIKIGGVDLKKEHFNFLMIRSLM
jgi:RHS repeat-associated protein